MNERVLTEGHHLVVYDDPRPGKGVSVYCPQCGLRVSTGLMGRTLGVTDEEVARDAVARALARVPVRDCLLVPGWLLAREVMET